MSEELEPYRQAELDVARTQALVGQLQWQRDEIAKDLEKALNFCRDYQRILNMLATNDPNWAGVNQLLIRYKMDHERTSRAGKIFVDGQDITDHPDSIEASVIEAEELPESETPELSAPDDEATYTIEDDDGYTD